MQLRLLVWINGVIDHGSQHIVLVNPFDFSALRSDGKLRNQWMCWPVKHFKFATRSWSWRNIITSELSRYVINRNELTIFCAARRVSCKDDRGLYIHKIICFKFIIQHSFRAWRHHLCSTCNQKGFSRKKECKLSCDIKMKSDVQVGRVGIVKPVTLQFEWNCLSWGPVGIAVCS